MSTTINEILNLARTWIGKKESDGTHKEIIDIYNAHKPLARNYKVKYTDNWCAVTISSLAIKCNATDIIPLECSCGNMIALAQKMGIWQENDDIVPQPGYIIMYDWDKKDGWPEHVGIVESVSGKTFTVIEGNKSDAVGRRTVNVGSPSIRGFIIPKYTDKINVQTNQSSSQSESSVNYKVKVNTPSGVNCRKEPNADSAKITAYTNGTELTITKESGNWGYANNKGWVCLDYCKKVSTVTSAPKPATSNKPSYGVGKTYTLQTELKVRTGPGTNYSAKKHSQLTSDGKKHDKDGDGALDKGTVVTCKEVRNVGNDIWIKSPSGWLAAYYQGNIYIK